MEEQKQLKYDHRVWFALFRHLKQFKWEFVKLISLMSTVALLDIVFPLFTSRVIDHHVKQGQIQGIGWLALGYLLLSVVFALLVYQFIRIGGRLEARISYKLRQDQFEKLQRLSMSYFDRNATGWILSRIGSDTGRISETIAWGVVDMVWALAMVGFVSISMLIVHVRLAIITIVSIPVLALVTMALNRKILAMQRIVRSINSRIIGLINDGIVGAKTSKTLAREEINIKEFGQTTEEMRKMSIRSTFFSASYMPFSFIISAAALAATLYFGGGMVEVGGISYGTLVLFLTYARMFFDPVLEISRIYSDFIRAQAAGERILELVHEKEEIVDRPDVLERYGDINHPKTENWEPLRGEIEFRNVSFAYKEGENILTDFSLKIDPGQTVAIVGRTGAGKSTIVNLACRFYEPTEGEILIDGVDYRERSQAWLHSNLGYVLQTPHLFSGTIRDNIRFGKMDATDAEIEAAAKVVNAHDFIVQLDKGYDTQVGEGGALLSTGQKQLVSFARAIIGRPALFVLDEATSSIDTETEASIQDAIDHLLSERTSFVIAHRLSTVRRADRILVLEEGRVIESGTHRELMALRGHYYDLYTNQYYTESTESLLGMA
ncbi:MAG: ABC transporter ATP-binding protein [Bacillota bacterium]|nr:ABC transporter ATP-binding protein [Bacillota bacterium]